MKKKRRRLPYALAGMFDLPGETLPRTSAVTLTSDREALVTGCRRIKEYDRCRVVLALCDCEITVTGEGLTMKTFFANQVQICGRITEGIFG